MSTNTFTVNLKLFVLLSGTTICTPDIQLLLYVCVYFGSSYENDCSRGFEIFARQVTFCLSLKR